MKPGTRVTAVYRNDHEGTVIAINDPRAWANTMAMGFDNDNPTQEQVDNHLEKLEKRGIVYEKIAVLWDFGKVYFEEKRDLCHISLIHSPAMVDTGDGAPQYTFAPTGQLSLL